MKNAKKILKDARKLIKSGWVRRNAQRRIGQKTHYCLSYAISRASSYQKGAWRWDPGEMAARSAVTTVIDTNFPEAGSMIGFNDNVAKDKRYVLRVLDQAIESL